MQTIYLQHFDEKVNLLIGIWIFFFLIFSNDINRLLAKRYNLIFLVILLRCPKPLVQPVIPTFLLTCLLQSQQVEGLKKAKGKHQPFMLDIILIHLLTVEFVDAVRRGIARFQVTSDLRT